MESRLNVILVVLMRIIGFPIILPFFTYATLCALFSHSSSELERRKRERERHLSKLAKNTQTKERKKKSPILRSTDKIMRPMGL